MTTAHRKSLAKTDHAKTAAELYGKFTRRFPGLKFPAPDCGMPGMAKYMAEVVAVQAKGLSTKKIREEHKTLLPDELAESAERAALSLPRAVFVDLLPPESRPSIIVRTPCDHVLPPALRNRALPVLALVPGADGSVFFLTDTDAPFLISEYHVFVAPPECVSIEGNLDRHGLPHQENSRRKMALISADDGLWQSYRGNQFQREKEWVSPYRPRTWRIGATDEQKRQARALYSRSNWGVPHALGVYFRDETLAPGMEGRLSMDSPRHFDWAGEYCGALGAFDPGQLGVFPTHVVESPDTGEAVYLRLNLFSLISHPVKGLFQEQKSEKTEDGLFLTATMTPDPKTLLGRDYFQHNLSRGGDIWPNKQDVLVDVKSGIFYHAREYNTGRGGNWDFLSRMVPLAATPLKPTSYAASRDVAGELAATIATVRERIAITGLTPAEAASLQSAGEAHGGGKTKATAATPPLFRQPETERLALPAAILPLARPQKPRLP